RGAVQGLVELREQGAVGAIGVAAGPSSLIRQYVQTDAFDAVLSHNRYTLVDSSAADLFEEARRRDRGVFNAAPYGGGLLAGADARYAYRPAPEELLDWVHRASAVCARHGVSLAAVALSFSARSQVVSSTVVGAGTAARLAELDALLAVETPAEVWPELESLG